MTSEESAQAAVDIKTEVMMPIHWGAFTLSLHNWNDPVIRVTKAARELEMAITVPVIGDPIELEDQTYYTEPWWMNI